MGAGPETAGPVLDLGRGRTQRRISFVAGCVLLGLGLASAVNPVVPTTGLIGLAGLALARSSSRLHTWVYYHDVLGPAVRRWQRYGVVSARAKVLGVAAIVACLVYLALSPGVSLWMALGAAPVLAVAAGYVLTRPSRVSRRRALRLVVSS